MASKKGRKVETVMGEFKRGELKSSSGEKVTDRDQALAIAMSEAGMSKKVSGGRTMMKDKSKKMMGGGKTKKYASGGKIDGAAKKGKTKGRMC